ncbi:hypothetical protein [Pseudonocardia sp. ICBG601]|uniref:hypothetical protein n=1 Tax=Pseudonocardia sp. ICBG601 TaxID=2846759 RepID=UPI001CF6A975|nr:hypothetical protein [Pseudonocardia sp. ICBG601]
MSRYGFGPFAVVTGSVEQAANRTDRLPSPIGDLAVGEPLEAELGDGRTTCPGPRSVSVTWFRDQTNEGSLAESELLGKLSGRQGRWAATRIKGCHPNTSR